MFDVKAMALKAHIRPIGTNPAWTSISNAVNRLFELKRFPELAVQLSMLNENVSVISKSDLGQFIGEYYHDHILSQCMTKLGEAVVDLRDEALITKLTEIWVQFYTSILPTLLAIFASVQSQQNKLSIRALTLISFRDNVLLKTKLNSALACYESDLPPQIQQMLLVLQSVHRSPPDDRFYILQDLVAQVVDSYLPMVPRLKAFHSASTDSSRTGRAGTMDILDTTGSPDHRREDYSRRHNSMGPVESLDLEDDLDPVTRL